MPKADALVKAMEKLKVTPEKKLGASYDIWKYINPELLKIKKKKK